MSTREIAMSIFNTLTEDQLKAFVILFKGNLTETSVDQDRRQRAWERLESTISTLPRLSDDFDEDLEREQYFKEKYSL